MGLPGANPRAVPSRDQPPRESYGQQPQGSYGGSYGGSGQGYGGQGGYGQPQRSPGMPSNYEKSPMSPPRGAGGGGGGGGGRQVPLTVGKVQDKTMQSHLIYHNKSVHPNLAARFKAVLTVMKMRRVAYGLPSEPRRLRPLYPHPWW